MAGIGHNSDGLLGGRLKEHIEALERMDEEKAGIAAEMRDRFAIAKGEGYDVKAIRTILRERKMDKDEREEREAVLDMYRNALNDLD